MARTSATFRFIEEIGRCEVIRHEVSSASFAAVRNGFSRLIEIFGDEEGGDGYGDRLRAELLYWLTAPVDFRSYDTAFLAECGTTDSLKRQWGDAAAMAFEQCAVAIDGLREHESPLRVVLRSILAEQIAAGATIRLHCHRRARPLFESLLELDAGGANVIAFIHSSRDYGLTAPFDVLVHVGPLRNHGFAAIPPATLNAARQKQLIQVVWAGLRDEVGFGADPVERRLGQFAGEGMAPATASGAYGPGAGPTTTFTYGSATDRLAESALADELELFGPRRNTRDLRFATMIHLGVGAATFVAPGTDVLAWRRDGKNWRPDRIAAGTLSEGDYLIRTDDMGDADFGGVSSRDGQLSVQWKERLNAEMRSNRFHLIDRLRAAGLDLVHLKHHLPRWSQAATSVTHAPQQREHFRILIAVLGIEDDRLSFPRPPGVPWWRLAWREVQRSRGQAIQAGMQEQDIVDGELLQILATVEIPDGLATGATKCTVALPGGRSLSGNVVCYRIDEVESGFQVPETVLHALITPQEGDQWRA